MWVGRIQSVEGLARTEDWPSPSASFAAWQGCSGHMCEWGSTQAGKQVPAHEHTSHARHTSLPLVTENQESLESIPSHGLLVFLTKPRALVQPVVTKVSTGYGNGEEQRETQVQVPDKRGRKKGAKSKRTKYALEAASDKQLQKGDQCQDSLSHPQSQTSPSCCVSAWTKQIGLCFSLS